MARVIGVDLVTTNSCVAVMEGQAPRVIEAMVTPKSLALSVASVAESVVGASVSTVAIDQEGDLPGETWESLDTQDALIFGSSTYIPTRAVRPGSSKDSLMPAPIHGWPSGARTRSLRASPTPLRSTGISSSLFGARVAAYAVRTRG
jgi:hypothetical protein